MPMSEARRRANQKWDAANNTVMCCKCRNDEAAEFKEACKVMGTSPNAVFLSAMRSFMAEYRNGQTQSSAQPS